MADKTKDIFEGENLQVWDDEGYRYLSIGGTTIAVPKDDGIWDVLEKDLKKFVKELD